MIKLYTGHGLPADINDYNGISELKNLREDLEECFRNTGIKETWILDHLLLTVVEECYDNGKNAIEKNKNEDELDKMVTRLLVDTGYPDVAARFSRLRGLSANSFFSSRHLPWNEKRLHQVVSKRLPLSEKACQNLVKRLSGQLRTLAFQDVSDRLINELAEHNIDALARYEREKTNQVSEWLITPGYWEAFFSDEVAQLTCNGILSIHPVSQLFSVPRITMRLVRLVENMLEKPVTELRMLPVVKTVCINMAEVADILIAQNSANRNTDNIEAYLLIEGLDKAIQGRLQPQTAKERNRLKEELTKLIRETLETHSKNELVVLMQ